ncbi:hypothetical protein [Sphingomonas kyeonggiensis]|uniref:Lipoprotein n=1 Tax=Sphingomonas kyeonggiensis TaxID=1268553 RepID=A0A7W6NX33_9SPHN|nr:hypothetical protein [Sphingomonas kyeonggiensis]MBB4099217.1 hypothetical protein [Sphingomonas kyeonggiensis]
MANWGKISAILLACALAGCTTNFNSRLAQASDPQPSRFPSYRLPVKKYELSISWRLEKCLSGAEMEKLGVAKGKPGLVFKVKPDYTSSIVEGPETFVIDYHRMTNRFKIGEMTAEYYQDENKVPTRLLRSINATIEGREPEALKSGIQAVANVAKTVLMLSGGIPAGGANGVRPPNEDASCLKETFDAIADLKAIDGEMEEIADEAKRLENRFTVLKARVVFGKLGKADRRQYEQLAKDMAALVRKRERAEGRAAPLRSLLTYTETFTYQPGRDPSATEPLTADATKAKAFLQKLVTREDAELAEDVKQLAITVKFEANAGEFTSTVITDDQLAVMCGEKDKASQITPCEGVVYREPALGKLVIQAKGADGKYSTISDKAEQLPQVGMFHILPLRSRWGEKNTLSVDFAPIGLPTKVSYKSLEAGGAKMVEAVNQATASALDIATGIRKQNEADAAKEKTPEEKALADLKQQLELADTQAKLVALNKPQDPAEAARARELAALKQEVELADNRAKLRGLTATPDEQAAALTAEIAILRLLKEKKDLEADIREAD